MRQDVKIGILVGGLVVVAAVIWFLATGGEPEPPATPETDDGGVRIITNDGADATDGGDATDDDRTGADAGPPSGRSGSDDGGSGLSTVRIADATDDGARTFDPGAGSGIASDTTDGRTPATDGRDMLPDDGPVIDTAPVGFRPAGSGTSGTGGTDVAVEPPGGDTTSTPPGTVDPGGPGVVDTPGRYTVVAGDLGFWGIAKKVYGAGKYHYLIAEANPGVDSTRLQIGEVLIIPPAPQQDTTPAAGADPVVPAGSPTGTTTYVVAADDHQGLWGISRKVYGASRHFQLIADANPDIDPRRLQVGDVLIIPPRPASDRAATGGTSTPTGTDSEVAPAGYTYYTVQDEDQTGYWGIAKKFYPDARLYVAIEQANPDVDSRALQVGQRLLIPSLAQAQRLAGQGTSGTTGGSGTGPDEPSDLPVNPDR